MVTEPLAQELVWWREDGNHLIMRKRQWRLHRVLGKGAEEEGEGRRFPFLHLYASRR